VTDKVEDIKAKRRGACRETDTDRERDRLEDSRLEEEIG